jgi:hypothetical protein
MDGPLAYTKFINTPIGSYLISISWNHFFEAISIMKSIFIPTIKNGKKEISFINLDDDLLDKETFKGLKKIFIDSKFHIIRDNIIDHKNKDILTNPFLYAVIPIDKNVFDNLNKIHSDLMNWGYKNYDLTTMANVTTITLGLKYIIEQIKYDFTH